MNAQRRKQIGEVMEKLQDLSTQIESIKGDEESAFEALPEGIQGSDRGERMYEAVGSLDDAYTSVEAALDSLREANE